MHEWGTVLVWALMSAAGGAADAQRQPAITTVRALAAAPDQYLDRAVTVTGRFTGAPRPGRAPASVRAPRGRWDFLLTWDEAAVWVTGVRPAGRDFDLDPLRAAAGDSRWLAVTGIVRSAPAPCFEPGCVRLWLEATDVRAAPGPVPVAGRTSPQGPAVVFHDPYVEEAGVPCTTRVRLQFSRQMLPGSFAGRIRVSYASARPLAAPPLPAFEAAYDAAVRGLDIRFTHPLAPASPIRVELLDGIVSLDGQVLPRWELTFVTGN